MSKRIPLPEGMGRILDTAMGLRPDRREAALSLLPRLVEGMKEAMVTLHNQGIAMDRAGNTAWGDLCRKRVQELRSLIAECEDLLK